MSFGLRFFRKVRKSLSGKGLRPERIGANPCSGIRNGGKMPCRDDYRDGPSSYQASLKESQRSLKRLQDRNDELAAENCALRAFICSNYDSIDTSNLSDHHAEIFKKALKDQKIHRGNDKKRAMKSISKKIDECKKRVAQIKKLGGVASNELLSEIREHQAQLTRVKDSNPMETDLY